MPVKKTLQRRPFRENITKVFSCVKNCQQRMSTFCRKVKIDIFVTEYACFQRMGLEKTKGQVCIHGLSDWLKGWYFYPFCQRSGRAYGEKRAN